MVFVVCYCFALTNQDIFEIPLTSLYIKHRFFRGLLPAGLTTIVKIHRYFPRVTSFGSLFISPLNHNSNLIVISNLKLTEYFAGLCYAQNINRFLNRSRCHGAISEKSVQMVFHMVKQNTKSMESRTLLGNGLGYFSAH